MKFIELPDVLLNGKPERLAHAVRVRDERNAIVMPGVVNGRTAVVNYLRAARGQVREVGLPHRVERGVLAQHVGGGGGEERGRRILGVERRRGKPEAESQQQAQSSQHNCNVSHKTPHFILRRSAAPGQHDTPGEGETGLDSDRCQALGSQSIPASPASASARAGR